MAGSEVVVVQFGKGFLLDVLKSSISCRTMLRRSNKQSSKRCSSARSPYHSHGISSAIARNCCTENRSIRDSHGAKSFHDSIRSYTSLSPYTPRNGASGKLHSPALKQYPKSMNDAVYFRSRMFFVEHYLPAIRIARPLVEGKQTSEFPQIPNPPKHCPWQPVQNLAGHQGRTKLKPWTHSNRPASQREGNLLLQDCLFVHQR